MKIKIDNNILKYKIKKRLIQILCRKNNFNRKRKRIEFLCIFIFNKFICYINIIGGYFYEFLYDSLESDSLPNKQLIKINNKDIDIFIYDD